MELDICDTRIHYEVSGSGQDIVLLHGWGQNIEMMEPLAIFLAQWFRVWSIDLPGGAGKSAPPPQVWDTYEYTEMLHAFIEHHKIENPSLIGHSFGGRMSIIYAATYKTNKIVLLDAAGIKPKRGLDYYAKVYSYKIAKKVQNTKFFSAKIAKKVNKAGSADYQNATPLMKQVMTKVVNQDLRLLLPEIDVPTLIIWGELDEATPLSDAKIMEQKIPNAGLVILKGAGHYAYLECLPQVKRVLASFFSREIENN
ncbi:alpha/beta hydrolase [Erysipelotrichaceae bacterium]|nr:alpha/beta hydrolase [Erysipelotrichaceae bacterium]